MRLRYLIAGAVAVPLLAGVVGNGGSVSYTGALGAAGQQGVAPVAACVKAADAKQLGLTASQIDVASRGIAAAERAGVGRSGAEIIVSAGLVESDLANLPYGDRDSLGWLQQRPSQGWNNATDVDRAADDFFASMRELVPDWAALDQGAVAQRVQRSAFPARYGQRMPEARNIVATLTGAECPTVAPPSAGKAGVVLAWAQTRVGDAYILGANGPNVWDCSSFSRTAMAQIGVSMPRTAQGQRDWCAQGNCERVPDGAERPGDLIFWDSYLGPNTVGHVVIVKDPAARQTVDARSRSQGVINGSYPLASKKNIFEIWRPKGLIA
ncbi:MAG: NlpC/P60 family protein [Dermatophilus congolensis]|nr:NlpC/P60 family protein [Dermatophilus congolensis]